ncbi:hypothetical protein Tco_0260628 [Tanacetum coccineum]
MKAIQAFLKEYDHIPPEEKPMAFLLAEDKFLKIKQAIEEEQNQPEDIQELMLKLLNDLKIYDGILLKQEEQAVQNCSKQCLESFKTLQKNYDTEREKHNKAKLEIRGYEIALKSLEARILGHEKNELAWGERYKFQNYDLKCREIKINNLNLELEKVVKERDELKLKIEKWEGSSKNLTKNCNSHVIYSTDKNGLGFGTQMDDLGNKSESYSENSLTVFEVRSSDEESTLENNRFTKANEYQCVSRSCHYSSVKPNVTQAVRSQTDKSGQTSQKQGIGFKKVHKIKACFVCKSTGHLIKDYDFYDQKSPEPRISMDLRMDRGNYYSSMVFHMANLKYSDKHNMVAFLKKPNESVGFTEVVDFLKGTSLRAAVDQGEGSSQPAKPHHTPVDPISSTSQPPIPSPPIPLPHPSPLPHSPLQSPPHLPL